MAKFKHEGGDWARFKQLPNLATIDFHFGSGAASETSYRDRMDGVYNTALEALRNAQADAKDWVLLTHGRSTSRLGATTARSVIRGLMRSPEATPLIDRSQSIQHDSVFVARIRRSK